MRCHACRGRFVYRSSAQEAAKSDSKFSSSCDSVDASVSLNERKNGEEWVSGGLCVLVFMFMRNLELTISSNSQSQSSSSWICKLQRKEKNKN